jgi:protein gp37
MPLRWERLDRAAFAAWESFKATNPGLTDDDLLAKGFHKPRRRRVFYASLADVFDNEVPAEWRVDLFFLLWHTPNLDWLLLTKRIGNVPSMLRDAIRLVQAAGGSVEFQRWLENWNEGAAPRYVWLGATIANQVEADRDIPKLLRAPAAVRFLSMEPLLGPVGLWPEWMHTNPSTHRVGIDWVIAGGESGHAARPMHPDWARSLRDQCAAAGVPFLFKQNGEWVSVSEVAGPGEHYHFPDGATVRRTGKKLAGRTLNGVEHNGYPEASRG